MSGWMEIAAQFDEPARQAIIPTVVLPFTVLGMILTGVATWIAAAFGIELKAEGPKRLFEVLMKPKILLLALLSNVLIYGAVRGAQYALAAPYPLWWVRYQNSTPKPSAQNDGDDFSGAQIADPGTDMNLAVVWEKNLHEISFASPAIYGDSIFLGTRSGRILEIDARRGEKWRSFEIGQPVMVTPLLWRNKIYAGEGVHETHHARLYAFDLNSGKFLNAFSTEGHIERAAIPASVPSSAGDRAAVLFPAGKDGLYLVDAESLEKIWQAPVGHVDSMPVIDGNTVFVGTGQEKGFAETTTRAIALDLQTGQLIWEKTLATSSWGVPVIWEKRVCFSVGDVYLNSGYGQLACYDGQSGELYFAFNTDGALIGQPSLRGDHLIVSDLYGKIYQFNLRNRSLEWTIAVPTVEKSYSSVQMDPADRLILPGKEGLYIYSRETQKLLALWKPASGWNGSYTNVVFYKNLWIFADKKGILWALKPAI